MCERKRSRSYANLSRPEPIVHRVPLSTAFFLTVTTVTRVRRLTFFRYHSSTSPVCSGGKKTAKPSDKKRLEKVSASFGVNREHHCVCLFVFNVKDQKDRIYSTVKSKSTSATVNNLKPSTAYVFQIRAFTSAGYGIFGPRLEVTTKDESSGSGMDYMMRLCFVIVVYESLVCPEPLNFREILQVRHILLRIRALSNSPLYDVKIRHRGEPRDSYVTITKDTNVTH